MHKSTEIRVRIAPSPTGNLHIGTARAALFNWLYARREGGKFILRIEDTDLERSDQKFEKNIVDGLRWLGLDWDEGPDILGPYGPYRQSERLEVYEKYISKLLSENWAYYCACSKEELDEERQKAISAGKPQIYSGKCRDKKNQTGELIRFKMPPAEVVFKDLIRGNITFNGALIGDFAIAKNLRTPLYNFSVVVDDIEMKITQVIRGEDHIANTPKQIAIFRALDKITPEYGHLPLVLDKDRAKLSKRFSAVSVDEYRQDGFLEDALVNFLALLGWHPEGDKEIMDRDELVARFSLERVQKGGAVFDIEKLKWMNAQYIKKMPTNELLKRVTELVPRLAGKITEKFIELTKDRASTLRDFETETAFLLEIGEYRPELLVWKTSDAASAKKTLIVIEEKLSAYKGEFVVGELEKIITPLAEEFGRGEVFWPLRVALSGLKSSPGPLLILEALGKDESIQRIRAAISKLS
jgi:glutamyl-tRNA synthetase